MSKSIPQVVIDELASQNITACFLFKFADDGNEYFYTDLDVPVYSDADGTDQLYTPIGFKFESLNYSMGNIVDDLQIRIDNLNSVMTSIFLDGSPQGQDAGLWLLVIDSTDGSNIGVVKLFGGELDEFMLDEQEIAITVTSIFNKWSQTSHSKHSPSCRWKVFAGTECRYSGTATSCDRSYTTCSSYQNIEHFGGFRFLPRLENTTIWWGPNPSQRQAMG